LAAGDLALNILISANASNVQSVVSGVTQTLKGLTGGSALGGVVTAGAAAAAAVVGIGVAAVKSAGDFQQSMTQLVTGAGEAQSNIKQVSAGILQLSTATGTSTKDLSAAMYEIESSGQHGAAGLQVLKAAAEGARVGNADLDTVAKALTTTLTDYHMPATAATSAMNGLVAAVAAGKTHMQDMASAMGNVLPLASSLHISFPQVAGAISTMTNAGMTAQRASMNLANAIRSLAAPGASAQKAMQEVGLSAQQLKDTLSNQGLAAAIQLIEDHVNKKFPAGSVQAVAAFKAIMGGATGYNVALMLGGQNMQAYENNIKSISAAMANGKGDVQGWALVQQDFNFQIDRAKAALNVLLITLGEKLLPIVTPVVTKIGDFVGGLSNLINGTNSANGPLSKFQETFKLLGVGFAYVKDIVSQVASVIASSLAPMFQSIGSTASNFVKNGLNPIIAGFNGILFAVDSTIGPVTTQVMKFFANMSPGANLLQALSSHAQDLGKWFQSSVIPAFKQAEPGFIQLAKAGQSLLGTLSSVGNTVHNAFQGAFSALLPVFEAIIPYAIKLAGVISDVLGKAIQFLAPYVSQAVAALGQFVVEITQRIAPILVQMISQWNTNLDEFLRVWNAVWPFLAPLLKGVWDEIVGIVKVAWSLISGIINIGLDILGGNWKQAWSDFKDMLSGVWDGIKTYLQGAWEIISGVALAAWSKIQEGWRAAGSFFQNIGESIGNTLKQAWSTISDAAQTAWKNIAKIFSDIGSGISQNLQSAWNGIVTSAKNAWSAIQNTAQTAWNDLVKFIKSVIQNIVDDFQWLYQHNYYFADLVDFIRKVMTDVTTWLKKTWENVVTWITDQWNSLKDAATSAWQAVQSAVETSVSDVTNAIQSAWNTSIQWLTDQWNSMANLATTAWNAVSQAFSRAWNAISSALSALWNNISKWWTTTTTQVSTAASNLWKQVSTVFGNAWSTYIQKPLATLLTNIQNWFNGLIKNVQTWVANMMNMFAQGITNGAQAVIKAATNVGQQIASILGFHSPPPTGPLATSNTWMPNMMNMFAQGITSGLATVQKAATNVAQTIKNFLGIQSPAATGPLSTADTWMPNLMSMFSSQITQNTPKVTNATNNMTQQVQNAVNQMSIKVQQDVQNMMQKISNVGTSLQQMQSQVSQSVNQMQTQVSQATQQMAAQVNLAVSQANLAITNMQQTVSSSVSQMNQQIASVSQSISQMQQSVSSAINSTESSVQNATSAMSAQLQQTNAQINAMSSNAQQQEGQVQQGMDVTVQMMNSSAQQISQVFSSISDFANSQSALAKSDIQSIQQDLSAAQAANNKLQLIEDQAKIALLNISNAVYSAMTMVANSAASFFGHSEPSAGPLAGDSQWGIHFLQNFVSGMQSQIPALATVSQQAALQIIENFLPNTKAMATDVKTALAQAAAAAGDTIIKLKQSGDDIYATIRHITSTGGTAGIPATYATTTANVRGDIPIVYQLTPAIPGTAGTQTAQNMTIHIDMDGKSISKIVTKYQHGELRAQGGIRNV
jgi:TP901 family phage tail tape measure protein